jgi:2-polyprenyl-3-methyl-5-hydroxy-6-metoxy-1,4-benzoquinol methylase
MKEISNCPICDSAEQQFFMATKDFSVSGESFNIVSCKACGFHFTNPIPAEDKIGAYYKSESYVSHSSSKKGFINRIYHVVRWYSLRRKRQLIASLTKGRNLLDVGAGTGHFLRVAKNGGWSVIGLEPDSDARIVAKAMNGVELLPIEELHNLKEKQFDVITMWHVLEHVYHLNRDVDRLVSLLKPDGVLVIAVPNMKSYDANHYKEFWAAYDLPIHLYHFTGSDIRRLFDRYGLDYRGKANAV